MLAPASLKCTVGQITGTEDDGLILAESGAILEYLQETYDTNSLLKPQDRDQQYRFGCITPKDR
jgi:glutathione S-transferase